MPDFEAIRQSPVDAYRLLNMLREAAADYVGGVPDTWDHSALTVDNISGPGESEPGEFYLTIGRNDYAVRVIPM